MEVRPAERKPALTVPLHTQKDDSFTVYVGKQEDLLLKRSLNPFTGLRPKGNFFHAWNEVFVLVLSYGWRSILLVNTRRKRLRLWLLKLPSTQKDHINKLWGKVSKVVQWEINIWQTTAHELYLIKEFMSESRTPVIMFWGKRTWKYITPRLLGEWSECVAIWWVGASGGKMTSYGLEKSDACLCLCWTLFLLKFKPLYHSPQRGLDCLLHQVMLFLNFCLPLV